MFNEDRKEPRFTWESLGDITAGRPNLGLMVPVLAYRLFQYTVRDVLIAEYGVEQANRIVHEAGRLAGKSFCEHLLDRPRDFSALVAQLQQKLKELHMGILRLEEADLERMEFTLTIAEDLDCSGLPMTEEVVCIYEEGFIAGILQAYSGKNFTVKEIDCWASGGRVCRFHASLPAQADQG